MKIFKDQKAFTPLEIKKNKFFLTGRNNKFLTGFTLIELLVAMAIFLAVTIITTSIFLTTLKNQRSAFVAQNLQDNTRYIMETIAKEIRMAKIYTGSTGGDGSQSLFIKNQNNIDVMYCFTTLGGLPSLSRQEEEGAACGSQALNSKQIKIDGRFYIRNNAGEQKRVTIILHAYPAGASQPEIWLQDSITNRLYE